VKGKPRTPINRQSASARSQYRFGRSNDWIKVKNPAAPAVKREAEEDWSTLGKRLR
jgi:hypothetical protein